MEKVTPVLNPAYLLRSYAWQVLKRNMPDVWDETKYGNLIPIVPLAEEPELSEYSGPRIVYGYSTEGSGDLYAREFGSMTFAIYDQNFRRLSQTLNILKKAFERQDETARDVNEYSDSLVNSPFEGLSFAQVSLGFIEGGTPEDEEGGRQSALLNIRYEYHVDFDVVTSVI